MVYRGKPSRGCANCKKRHIKCDETSPECGKCVRSGWKCPGYKDSFDLMLKDSTADVQHRYRNKDKLEPKKEPVESTQIIECSGKKRPYPSDTTLSTVGDGWPGSHPIRDILQIPPEQQALSFFFNTYILSPRDPRIRRGFADYLLSSYLKARNGSLLSLATTAVSLSAFGGLNGRNTDKMRGDLYFSKAISATRIAIQDPVESRSDETLMAVLLLVAYEHVKGIKCGKPVPPTHIQGAAALVKHRGGVQSATEISRHLAIAVQSELIRHAVWSSVWPSSSLGPANENLDILSESVVDERGQDDPESLLNTLSVGVIPLQARMETALSTAKMEEIITLFREALKAEEAISSWPDSIPPAWIPVTVAQPMDKDKDSLVYNGTYDIYPDPFVVLTWNRYRCYRMLVHSVIIKCASRLEESQISCDIRESYAIIQSLVDGVCSSAPLQYCPQGMPRSGHIAGANDIDDPSLPLMAKRTIAVFVAWNLVPYFQYILGQGFRLREGQAEWMKYQLARNLRIISTWG
ncbi:MAG: hypothetical protein M1834_008899 [Cirrosporium novae-zelandiae]|nr:MAG: hypothetical protein M1834_008899 [Cirrosporium novae-zelandiae]